MTSERIGIVGLGYVGLPLALTFVERGVDVVGFDTDPGKLAALGKGESYLRHIKSARVAEAVATRRLRATSDFKEAGTCTALIICVPTPLTQTREPDLSYVERAAEAIAPHLRRDVIVSLESTTYPGTTRDVVRPILERSGLRAGEDFALVFSPEREDPGNPRFETSTIPKVVGGLTPRCLERGIALYRKVVEKVVPVSSLESSELTKLLENIFRAVNIALVNELKVLAHRFSDAGRPVDIFEVIQAAATKPFGFMPFFPGPGLGGHCIPIDPFYLTWKARELDFATRFIELAGEINTSMPYYVVTRLLRALSDRGRALGGAKVLILGVAYKSDVDDMRESPALKLIQLMEDRGAKVMYHDPFIPQLDPEHGGLSLVSVPLTAELIREVDAVVIATAHRAVDYRLVAANARLVIDTRNAMAGTHLPEERLVHA